ncbi:hypothetical protein K435DRAFT_857970 [Dendrothele bispora CBS 962.96]|uniref:Uncharacterized protein n=1 Tax=Dendrothele bispora (strain CBS 962.96) TaxID=1314807 RepID=A0A4S8M4G1_DENBC|nr:hypothetical protein K435DRAFT_857970 [Dendrothele bispora CBS 962.96]
MSLLTVRDIPVTRFHCDFRLTITVLSSEFAFEHNLQHTASIPLTIKSILSQMILGSDVQTACAKATEPGLPDTLQRLSGELVHTQPVALPPSYSFGPSATVIRVERQSDTGFQKLKHVFVGMRKSGS